MFYESKSGNTILKESLWYLYEKCTYIIKQDSFNLEKTETLKFENPLKDKYIYKTTNHKNYSILITVEWIGAPKEFLIKNEFKELNSTDYVNEIKEKRKIKKKV